MGVVDAELLTKMENQEEQQGVRKRKTIFGFSQLEIFNLYYCALVIDKEISKYDTNKEAEKQIPVLKGVEKDLPKIVCDTKGGQAIVKAEKNNIKDVFVCTKQSTNLLSFLKHLRNAIAHGMISKSNGYVIIRDYNKGKNQKTAYGMIKREAINSIIAQLLKIEIR